MRVFSIIVRVLSCTHNVSSVFISRTMNILLSNKTGLCKNIYLVNDLFALKSFAVLLCFDVLSDVNLNGRNAIQGFGEGHRCCSRTDEVHFLKACQ